VALSSIRGVVGKDVKGVGLFGGAGWDRYDGDVRIRVASVETGPPLLPGLATANGNLSSHRRLYFLGGSVTYVILQMSLEGGWAQGFGTQLPDRVVGDFDPSAASWFGSFAVRVTF
jgi:hypothetical protein